MQTDPAHHRRASRRRPWRIWTALIAVISLEIAGLGIGVTVGFGPPNGYAPWQDNASTVLRKIGLGEPLDAFENWLYTRKAPADTTPNLPGLLSSHPASAFPPYSFLPPLRTSADVGGWHPVGRLPGQTPHVYTALLQPDRRHRSVVVAAALLRSDFLSAHLVAGTAEPPGTNSPGHIPAPELFNVVAAFNSGFKMGASQGGFYLSGTEVQSLVEGKASAVIDTHGRLSVGRWGRDFTMNSSIQAVRQNLSLIVDHGQSVEGLDQNSNLEWGSARNQLQYTWRSGLGVTAHGDPVYVAGPTLNLATLASALAQAGVITGMELDIHSGQQFFTAWQSDGSRNPRPQPLMSTMVGPAERYVFPDTRDFFYFTAADDQKRRSP